MACLQNSTPLNIEFIHPHDLARHLHSDNQYVLLDCRPVLAYNSCHISGAVNVNFTAMMKKRFVAGKIGLADLVTTEEGRKRFRSLSTQRTVVYDEDTTDLKNLTTSNSLYLVVSCLLTMGQIPYLLEGGLSEFGTLHPSLCEISTPLCRSQSSLAPQIRASTPGMRDQALDWQTAPPVHVLSFLVLGSERDAKSEEVFDWFNIRYVLNVTPTCPNQFEERGVIYKRIAVSDTGTQKLSNQFQNAFNFIEDARKDNGVILIHCMAGISRSVTLTIAYIMAYFNLSMQDAYQYVKEKRPAISPNLNFMGQLVEFERYCQENGPKDQRDIGKYVPTQQQEAISKKLMEKIVRTSSTSSLSGKAHAIFESSKSIEKAEPDSSMSPKPFVLKPLNPKARRPKKAKEIPEIPSRVLAENSKPPEDKRSKDIEQPPDKNGSLHSSSSSNLKTSISTGSSEPSTGGERPVRPKSPKQVVVLSVKGEKLNLQHRRDGSVSPDRSVSPSKMQNCPEENDVNEKHS